MEVLNTLFLERLYPSFELLEKLDTVLYRNVIIYGAQGKGKSSLTNWLILKAKERYGERKVRASRQYQGLGLLLEKGIGGRPINILVADDLSLAKIKEEELSNFYRLRHLIFNKGIKIGLGVTILVIHDFFVIPRHLRSYFDALILCSPPSNRFDRSFVKSYVGQELLDVLTKLHSNYDSLEHLAIKAFWYLGTIGLLKTEDIKKEQANVLKLEKRRTLNEELEEIIKRGYRLPDEWLYY